MRCLVRYCCCLFHSFLFYCFIFVFGHVKLLCHSPMGKWWLKAFVFFLVWLSKQVFEVWVTILRLRFRTMSLTHGRVMQVRVRAYRRVSVLGSFVAFFFRGLFFWRKKKGISLSNIHVRSNYCSSFLWRIKKKRYHRKLRTFCLEWKYTEYLPTCAIARRTTEILRERLWVRFFFKF